MTTEYIHGWVVRDNVNLDDFAIDNDAQLRIEFRNQTGVHDYDQFVQRCYELVLISMHRARQVAIRASESVSVRH